LTDPDFVTSTLQILRPGLGRDRAPAADARIRHQASLLDKAQDAILVRDLEHRIIYWNKSAERLYGWSQLQALGQSVHPAVRRRRAVPPRHADPGTGEWTGEIVQRHRDGRAIDVEGRWTLVRGDDGQPSPSWPSTPTSPSARPASARSSAWPSTTRSPACPTACC
jgi:PAS domain S-box-containing protein